MPTQQLTTEQLITACRRGERRAQEELYRRYFPLLLPVCLRYLGSRAASVPVLNQAMLKIFQSLDAYQEAGTFEGWLVTITRRTVLSHLRDEGRAQRRFRDKDFVWPKSVPNTALDRLAVADILALLERLPDHLRLVFSLSIFDGLSHEEIAAELAITVSASRWRLMRARELLQTHYRSVHAPNEKRS